MKKAKALEKKKDQAKIDQMGEKKRNKANPRALEVHTNYPDVFQPNLEFLHQLGTYRKKIR